MAHWCIGHVMVMTFVALRAFFGSPVFVCSFVEVFLASVVLGCYVKLLFTGIEWDAIATATTRAVLHTVYVLMYACGVCLSACLSVCLSGTLNP